MRETWMGVVHLTENGEHVLMPFRCDGLHEHGDDGIAVGLRARRSHSAAAEKSGRLHTVPWANALLPNAETNAGNELRYSRDSGYIHRSTGSAANARTSVSTALSFSIACTGESGEAVICAPHAPRHDEASRPV